MGRGRKVTEFKSPQVAIPLNEGEQRAKALELARVCADIDKIRADAAAHASAERKRVRALDKERRLLTECVRTGTEMRDAQLELGGGKGKAIEANGKAGNGSVKMARNAGNVDA